MHSVLFPTSLREFVFWGWWNIYLWTTVLLRCYFAFVPPILEYCSPVWWSAAECRLHLLERQVYSVARLCPDQRFLALCHGRHVAGLSMLYKFNANSNHCLFSEFPSVLLEFDILELHSHWSLKFQGVECRNLQGVSCWLRFVCGMTFPTLHCVWHQNTGWVHECSQPLVASMSCVFFSFPWRRCLFSCKCNL